MFEVLRENRLFAKKSKCTFAQKSVEYLMHIISKEEVAADPKKVSDMLNWPVPSTIKQLRGFLGLTGYYRRFVKGYGVLSKPLYKMLQK